MNIATPSSSEPPHQYLLHLPPLHCNSIPACPPVCDLCWIEASGESQDLSADVTALPLYHLSLCDIRACGVTETGQTHDTCAT